MKSFIFTLFSFFLVLTSAFSQTKNLSFKFNHKAGSEPMEINKTIFSIHNGKKVKITRAQFYVSNITLFSSATDSTTVEESYVLVNANTPEAIYPVGTFPENYNFNALKMYVGIDKVKNHADPNLYPASHPLGPKSPDMHWGWAAGYRFIALEGLVDNNNDGVPEQEFQFHSLGDDLLFSAFLDMSASAHIDTEPMQINLDYVQLFNTLSMFGNLYQHGSSSMNKTVLLNAATGGFFTPEIVSSAHNLPFEQVAHFKQDNRQIRLDFSKESNKNVVIYSMDGQKVYESKVSTSHYNFELFQVRGGQYFITVVDGNQRYTKSFFIL